MIEKPWEPPKDEGSNKQAIEQKSIVSDNKFQEQYSDESKSRFIKLIIAILCSVPLTKIIKYFFYDQDFNNGDGVGVYVYHNYYFPIFSILTCLSFEPIKGFISSLNNENEKGEKINLIRKFKYTKAEEKIYKFLGFILFFYLLLSNGMLLAPYSNFFIEHYILEKILYVLFLLISFLQLIGVSWHISFIVEFLLSLIYKSEIVDSKNNNT